MNGDDKPLVWLHGEIKTPPFSLEARIEAGILLRLLQDGASIGMPERTSMQAKPNGCHELRIPDEDTTWRIIYRTDSDAIVIAEVFAKKTGKTAKKVVDTCKQ